MKNKAFKIFATLFLLFFNVLVSAQPGGGPNNPNPVRDPEDANIDSSIVWLLSLGLLFGIYIVYIKYQKRTIR